MNGGAEKKREKMLNHKVEPLIMKLAIPTIISMLITTFYNLVDTYFVGTLGNTNATAAVGIVYSLMTVIQAVGFFCGHGSGNYISRALGKKEYSDAEKMASTGFFGAIILGVLITIFGQILAVPFAQILGAKDAATLKYTLDYMRVILIGAPFMTAQFVLNNQLRFQGNALFAMIGVGSGGIINIGLDYLFISVFNLEVMGAAIATVIGQIISFIILYIGVKKSDNVKISIKNFVPNKHYIGEIARGGTPSLFRQSVGGIATSCMNNVAFSLGGADAQAAIAIVSRVAMFISSAVIGFGQGFQPVCGFCYGAGKYQRVRRAFFFSVKFTTIVLLILSIICYIFAPSIVGFMQSGEGENIDKVIEIGTLALRHQLIALPLLAFVVMSNMMLQTIGKVFSASVLALARQGLFLIPFLYLISFIFKLDGFLWVQAVADIFSFSLTIPIVLPTLRRLKNDVELE